MKRGGRLSCLRIFLVFKPAEFSVDVLQPEEDDYGPLGSVDHPFKVILLCAGSQLSSDVCVGMYLGCLLLDMCQNTGLKRQVVPLFVQIMHGYKTNKEKYTYIY